MVPVLKKLKVLTLLNLLSLLSYGASSDQFMTKYYISCTSGYKFLCKSLEAFRDLFLQSVLAHHFFFFILSSIQVWWCQVSWVWKIFFQILYTFIRTLSRLTIYMYYSRLLVHDIINLVAVSLLNVLVTIIRFVLEPIGFACVTAPIHLSSYCNQYTLSRNRD